MSRPTPIYDLMLLISTSAPEEQRSKILTDVESAISSGGGSVERNDDWGTRALAFQIDHQADAEYHLIQFSGPSSLLDSLSHSLKIDDGVLRFRIIKVAPGTPPAPDPGPAVAAAPAPAPAPAPAAPVPAAVAAVPDEMAAVPAEMAAVPADGGDDAAP